MPTTQKTWMFLASFAASLGSFIVICYALATPAWVSSTVSVSDASSNGSVVLTFGLFRGRSELQLSQGLGEGDREFEVLDKLGPSPARTLHALVVLCLVLSLAAALLGSGFTFYNSVSNPYQTFLGPVGVYTWSALGGLLALAAMVLFAASTQATSLAETLVQALYSLYPPSTHRGTAHRYGVPFWLLLLVILLDVAALVIIVFYQKARYQRKQEQRKPMEYAPKDGILF